MHSSFVVSDLRVIDYPDLPFIYSIGTYFLKKLYLKYKIVDFPLYESLYEYLEMLLIF